MVLLHNQNLPSRKRPPNSNSNTLISPLIQPPKIPKSSSPVNINENVETENLNPIYKMATVLTEAGCTLINPLGPPCLPSDTNKFRYHLETKTVNEGEGKELSWEKMSKKNDLGRRKRRHEFELRREKEKLSKKLNAKKNKMKGDGSEKKKKKGTSGFAVGKKKVKTKMTPLMKAKAARTMEVDK